MSTKTYGHLHEDDRAWFIADSFKWLVEHDRGEPMRAQKAHVCYACGGAIPAGEQYSGRPLISRTCTRASAAVAASAVK